jgi:hypothetical protein
MKQQLHSLSRLFKRMTVRERALLLSFLIVLVLIWANAWFDRASSWQTQRALTQNALSTQQEWLSRDAFFTEGLATALERVDPAKTYAASRLSGQVDSIIRQSGLSAQADIDPVRTREGEIFNDHNLRVRLSRISIAQLIQLNKLLSAETPYINIQNVQIQKNRRNPEQLDVRYEINSFDLKDPGLE